jgi:hypothetical protein
MDEGRYYIAEKVKECFGMVDSFNYNVLIQKDGKLEMLSSKVIKPKEIGIKLEKGIVLCTDNKYKLEEVTQEQALKKLEWMGVNYASWQECMSSSEDRPSDHLSHGGESLI